MDVTGRPRVLELFEDAIAGCRARDLETVRAATLALTSALDLRFEEAARDLSAVYLRCARLAARGRFDVAEGLFSRLADAVRGAASDEIPL